MEWSNSDLRDAGIVTLRRRMQESPGLDPRDVRALLRKVSELQRALAQRDALLDVYQQRIDALTAQLEGRRFRFRFKLFGR